jgi:hypothetical protein
VYVRSASTHDASMAICTHVRQTPLPMCASGTTHQGDDRLVQHARLERARRLRAPARERARAVHVGGGGRLGVVRGRVGRDRVEQRLGLRHGGWETGIDVARRVACLLIVRADKYLHCVQP